MSSIGYVFKLIMNFVLFCIYNIIFMFIGGMIYGKYTGNSLASNDPMSIKIAFVSILFTLLFAIVFRKYFFLKLTKKNKQENRKSFEKMTYTEKKDFETKIKPQVKEEIKNKVPEMEILIDKDFK